MTPLLCADIGNSHTTIGLLDRGEVVDHWRLATDERRTADEWAVLVRGLLRDAPDGDAVDGIAVCSTVPAVLHEWRDMLRTYHGDVPQVIVEPGVRTGVPVLMDNPREVGTDRIVNALASRAAQLRKVEFVAPRSVIAKNTVEALQSGILYGFASQVDGIVGRMMAELGLQPGELSVIATGGLAPVVVEECTVFTDHQPWLTLLGLEIVFDRNT